MLLFTGKGGVGKTSVAAATALHTSALGYNTVLISTDPAHSLSDCFDISLGPELRKVESNLFALEIDVQHELEANWSEVQNYLTTLFSSQGLDEVVAEEMAVLPASEEIASLLHICRYDQEKKFDVLVVDSAPTGEALRLLSFPDVMRWYMEKIFGLERKLIKVVRPVAKMVISAPLPSDRVMRSIEDLYQRINRVKDILENPAKTSIRLVSTAEKMVIAETQRAFSYLNLFGYPVDAVIINRLLPDEVKAPYFDGWKKLQSEYVHLTHESFYPLKILQSRLFEREIVGKDAIAAMAKEIYGEIDPTESFVKERPIKIFKESGKYVVSIKLPFTSKEDVDVYSKGEELIVRIKNWKRVFVLPKALTGLRPERAEYSDNILEVRMGIGNGQRR
ncbi:MAG: ArsA family ATPase [Candidatus Bathyarchaeia archaeon]